MVVARWTWGCARAPFLWGVAATVAVGMAWWLGAARGGRWRAGAAAAGLLGAAFCVGGWYYLGWRLGFTGGVAPYAGKPHEWWGTVTREPLVVDGRLEVVVRLDRVVPPAGGTGGVPSLREPFPAGGGSPVGRTVLIRVAGWDAAWRGDGMRGGGVGPAGDGRAPPVPAVGDLVRVYGTATLPSPPRNPGEFDYAGWLRAQGVAAVVRADGGGALEVRGKGSPGPVERVAAWLRARFLAGVRRHLPGVEGAVVEGMVLGIRTGLPAGVEDAFRRSGLVHLLAVSGSNVALVAGVAGRLLRWTGVKPALAGSLLGTWVFAAAASGGASVGRAAVMATVVLLGRLLGRPHNPLNSLAVAVVVLTAANPCAWEDPGFWLSVAATAGILGVAPRPEEAAPPGRSGPAAGLLPGLLRGGREVLVVTCAAQAAVLPVSLYYFQQASLVAPLSNLLVFPFTGAITVGGMLCAALAAVHPGLGVAFSPLGMVVRAVLGLARFFGGLPGAAVTLPAPRWPHLLAYYAAFAWVAGWLRWSLLPRNGPWTRPRLVLAALLVVVTLAVSVATAPPRHVLQVVFFSVGQGDAVLLWRPGGPAMLVDCGPAGPGYDAGADTLVPYLRRHGIRRLDLLVLTHGHGDHTGGAAAVLGNVPVARLWAGPGAGVPSRDGAGAHPAPVAAGPGGAGGYDGAGRCEPECVLRPAAGERAVLAPGWEVVVLHPPPPVGGAAGACPEQGGEPAAAGPSPAAGLAAAPSGSGVGEGGDDGENDASLVLLVRYGRVNILLAGDLAAAGEALFLREGARLCPRGVDLLKVPHHGSAASCSAAFLDRVGPRFAVVQVGPNPFGHPAGATLRRLEEAGARVWRTDLDGAVVARTDGQRLWVRAVLGQRRVPGLWGSWGEARR